MRDGMQIQDMYKEMRLRYTAAHAAQERAQLLANELFEAQAAVREAMTAADALRQRFEASVTAMYAQH
jgi:hypothetical protein